MGVLGDRRSFWPTRGALIRSIRDAGFSSVHEQFDQMYGASVQQLAPDGWYYRNARGMFMGLKPPGDAPQPGKELSALYASTSWKVTAPMRALKRLFVGRAPA
jgi:hypothetical protein